MKNIVEIKKGLVALFIILTGFGCSDNSQLGIPSNESTPPAQPKVTSIRNTNGGAVIHYNVPTDEDLLCVSATYIINGKKYTTKSSTYVDSIVVQGFGKEGEYSIDLRSIDKNRNESEPLKVTISPKESPVEIISKSLKVMDAFGGVRITWNNPTEANIIVSVSYKDSIGDWISLENFYSSTKKATATVRGLDTTPKTFGVSVRDRWDNYSEMLESEHVPLYEKVIDNSLFASVGKLPGDCTVHGSSAFSRLWDGGSDLYTSFFTDDSVDGLFLTLDLGQTAKLSRFKVWQLNFGNWLYNQSNLRHYDIYGCTTITAEMKQTGSLDGWTLICSAECYKPSGEGPVTNEDIEYISNGDEHEISLEAPAVRYIRIHMIDTWGDARQRAIGDIKFWGQVKK